MRVWSNSCGEPFFFLVQQNAPKLDVLLRFVGALDKMKDLGV